MDCICVKICRVINFFREKQDPKVRKIQEEKEKELLYKDISKELEALSGLETSIKKEKNEEIKLVMKYYNNLTDKIEERRTGIYRFALQTLLISLTAVGLLLQQQDKLEPFLLTGILFILFVHIIFSLAVLMIYEFQSRFRGYPFFRAEEFGKNKWKWFYYGSEHIQKINRHPFFPSKDFYETLDPYLKGLKDFVKNYKEETLDKEIRDNIQQLYILQVHNYFKNRFFLQLTRMRLLPLIISCVATIFYLICSAIKYVLISKIIKF